MRISFAILLSALASYSQLDTSGLNDNTWVNLWTAGDPLTVTGNNWAYENDFKSHPWYGFFIMGPGHYVHPQDCYWYPFDPVRKKWTKIDSPRRPPRQCLSAFAVSSQDTAIMQMGGFEASHQQSQGRWATPAYNGLDLGGGRGTQMWVYSFNRNEWYPMRGPVTLPALNATQLPQYDPVHDIVISTQGTTSWLYNWHTNTSWSLSSPTNFAQYGYSTAVDSRRGLYYALNSNGMYQFNPETGTWSRMTSTAPSHPVSPGGGEGLGLSMMDYDAVNDVIVYTGDDAAFGLPNIKTWIFNCDSLTWAQVTPATAPQDRGRLAYNRPLNAFVLLGGTAPGGISRGGGTSGIWAYRYKRGPGVFTGMAAAPKAYVNTLGNSPLLHWVAVTENGVTGYNIYRGTAATYPKGFVKINSSPVTDTFYTDASATAAAPYGYKVCAIKDGAEGEMSRILYTRPGRVLNPVASVEDTNLVRVSWDANPAEEVTGYHVYRAKGAGIYTGPFPSGWTKLTASPVTTVEYWDTVSGLRDGIARGYVVLAVNGRGDTSGVSPECTTFPESPEWAWVMPQNYGGSLQTAFRWKPPRRTKILGVNLWRIHPNQPADAAHRIVVCGGGNFFFDYSATTFGELWNGTASAPALITDSLTYWPMPPTAAITNSDITGYYLQSKTFIARAVNMLGQEGFGTDQISPNNGEYGFGIVTPAMRFNYTEWSVAVEEGPASGETVSLDDIAVWPNPSNPVVNVFFRMQKAGAAQIAVFNAQGRLILSEAMGTARGLNRRSINLSKQASGVYLVRVTAEGRTLQKKAVYTK